jgi:hypothetical protein
VNLRVAQPGSKKLAVGDMRAVGQFPDLARQVGRAVPSSLAEQRAASDAVHRKAEERPRTGRIRAFRQRGEVP